PGPRPGDPRTRHRQQDSHVGGPAPQHAEEGVHLLLWPATGDPVRVRPEDESTERKYSAQAEVIDHTGAVPAFAEDARGVDGYHLSGHNEAGKHAEPPEQGFAN